MLTVPVRANPVNCNLESRVLKFSGKGALAGRRRARESPDCDDARAVILVENSPESGIHCSLWSWEAI
jgi:hypothetical protein